MAIKKVIDAAPRIVLVVLIGIYLFASSLPFGNLFYTIRVSDLVAWCMGYYIVKYRVNIDKFDGKAFVPILYVVLLGARVALMQMWIPVLSLLLERLVIPADLLFWYCVFTRNTDGRVQKLFVEYSGYNFGIYLFHEMYMTFAKKVIIKLFGASTPLQIMITFFLPVAIIAFAIIFCKVFKRLLPKTFSVVTGARVYAQRK